VTNLIVIAKSLQGCLQVGVPMAEDFFSGAVSWAALVVSRSVKFLHPFLILI